MSDPHIDIDEVVIKTPSPGETAESKSQAGSASSKTDSASKATGFDDPDAPPSDRFANFSTMFSTLNRQFQGWQRHLTAVNKAHNDTGVLPDEARQHLRASQRELLLACRSFLDVSLERLEQREQREQLRREEDEKHPRRGATKIIIEETED
jgi:hypothetical protein